MINFGKIKKTYKRQVVLDIENFCIEENKIYTITGPNGSGKSTLAKILSGLISSDDNIYIKPTFTYQCKNFVVGYLPQKSYIFDLTLEKNILINGSDKNKCNELIKKFNIEYLKNKNAKSFSGGEQQKLSLARFMMKDYDMVILDEPTSAMDEKSQNMAEKIIFEYSNNKTMIIITHDINQIKKMSNKIIYMNNGKIV